MRRPILTAVALATFAWTLPALATETASDPAKAAKDDASIHGRNYTSHRTPGNHAFETPGGFHGHPRHGFEVGAHWDRTWPPALPLMTPGGAYAPYGLYGRGNAPWPLGNLDIEVKAD